MVSARGFLLVGIAALATSIYSLRNGFVYDDVRVIQRDEHLHTLHSLVDLFSRGYWTGDVRDKVYRPVTTLSFAVDWRLGRGSPIPFHAGNVVLHVIASLLVLVLASTALGRGAEIAGLWFAVQPVHVEAIANAVGRSELLVAVFYLAAILLYRADGRLAASDPGGLRRALASIGVLVCAAFAIGAKEHALTLPAGLMLMDWWEARVSSRAAAEIWRRHLLLWAGVVAIAAGYLVARSNVVGTVGAGNIAAGLEGLGLPQRILVMLPAALVWARLFLFPLHLSVDYAPDAFVPHSSPAPIHVAALALLAACAFLGWVMRRRAPAVGFGMLWIVITGAVAANIVLPTGVTIAERVLYLPSAGAAITLGALWALLPPRRVVTVVTTIALLLLATRAVLRIPVWSNEPHFYRALQHDAPRSYRAWWAQGAMAFEHDSTITGEMRYREALMIYPDPAVIQELGERYLAAKLYAPADRFLTMAWRTDTLRSDAALEAVVARQANGQLDSAATLGHESLRHFPELTTLLLATSDAEMARGEPLEGLVLRRRAAYLRPGVWQYQEVTADAAARAGLCAEARERAVRAATLAPAATQPRTLIDSLSKGLACVPRR